MDKITRAFLTIDGLVTAHAVFGAVDSTPVFALHGWGASIDLIAPLAARLAPLGYRVYMPDLPGFGQTAPPSSAWSVHDYGRFVIRYLDVVGLQRAHAFGHSFGGRLNLFIAAEYPERIDKMALADSAGVPPRRRLSERIRLSVYKRMRDALYTMGAKGAADNLRSWYGQRYGSVDYKSAGVLRETFIRVVNEDLLPYAARVHAPTLLIWGAHDEDTPLWQGKKLEQTIPDAGLVIYEDAGHYSYLDKLTDVVKTLDYFYKNDEQ